MSESIMPANGAGPMPAISMTFNPLSGPMRASLSSFGSRSEALRTGSSQERLLGRRAESCRADQPLRKLLRLQANIGDGDALPEGRAGERPQDLDPRRRGAARIDQAE